TATDEAREAVAVSADIIGAKWTALLIYDLASGTRRFRELEHSLAGISSRTLAERLRVLERDGIVRRFSYPESPPRVEYEPTDRGSSREVGEDTRLLGEERRALRDLVLADREDRAARRARRADRELTFDGVADRERARGGVGMNARMRTVLGPRRRERLRAAG